MKCILFFAAFLYYAFIGSNVYGQFKMDKPVSLRELGNAIEPGYELDYAAEKELVQKGKVTEEQYKLMAENTFAVPAGFKTRKLDSDFQELFYSYKAYKVAEWKVVHVSDTNLNRLYTMVWIPPAPNSTMPADLRPAKPNGFFIPYSRLINKKTVTVAEKPAVVTAKPAQAAKPVVKAAPVIVAVPVVTATTKQAPVQTEPPLVKGLSKEFPVKIGYLKYALLHNLDYNGIERAKTVFVRSGKFTEPVFADIVSRANINSYAQAINSPRKIDAFADADLDNAKCYLQGSFLLPFNGVAQTVNLVWLPRSENADFAPKLMPADGGGAYFFMADSYLELTNYHINYWKSIYLMPPAFAVKMKAKHSRAKPEKAIGELVDIYAGEHIYQPLRDLGYSEDEYQRMVKLASRLYVPEGLQYENYIKDRSVLKKYTAYKIAECNNGLGVINLYWAPKEENTNLPATLQPLTDEGVFFFTNDGWKEENKTITSKIYSNKPEWEIYPEMYSYYARGGTDKQAEEDARKAEIAATNAPNGRVAGTNTKNAKKPVKERYGKYSEDNVYKEEEKLINYLKYTDKQLNPLLDKILRSGKDAWILYKTKDKAHTILHSQVNACEAFLKEYGDYTTETFRADVETRLANARAVYGKF